MAFFISVVINVLVVLFVCLPIVMVLELFWITLKSVMYYLKVDWFSHEEKYQMGMLPKEYFSIYDMVRIKLEEEIHNNHQYRKDIIKKIEDREKDFKKINYSYITKKR